MRSVRNTLMVLVLSAVVATALYVGVEVSSAATGASGASATASGGQTYLCPVTGCSASSCHGATGEPAPTGTAGTSTGTTAAGTEGGSGQTLTCPRTGCTASTCHGATGAPPPSSGGRGYGGGSRNSGADQSSGIFEQ